MKETVTNRHPIAFSIILGILLTFIISIASAAAMVLKLSDRGLLLAQGAGFFLMAIIITAYMKSRNQSLSQFGFQKLHATKSKVVLYYIPLLIIAVIHPIMGGINTELAAIDILIIIIFSFLVGYTEESIFRGIIKEKLQAKGKVFFILFSSILFGILHMANAFSGKNLTSVILQVVNAFLIGLILSLLITIVNSIIPLIAFHFLYDTLAIATRSNEKEILLVSILNALYILYGIYLVVILRRREKDQVNDALNFMHART